MRFVIECRSGVLGLVIVLLAGCAGMGREECEAVDWRTVGYEDGAAGRSIDQLTSRRQACAKHGVAPDLDAYRSGREEGLVEFCQPANAFRMGVRGRDHVGGCPSELAAAFNGAYQDGRGLWRLETRLNEALRGIAARRAEIERIDKALVTHGALILAEGVTAEERAQAMIEVRSLAERRGRAASEIEGLERAVPVYEMELEDYRAGLAFFAY